MNYYYILLYIIIFKQKIMVPLFYTFKLYYFMCAHALNNLLLRKDLSYWAKGMQIRFNLSHLEQWIRDKFPYVRIYSLFFPMYCLF